MCSCKREREREYVCVREYVCARVCACVRARVSRVRCMKVCVSVLHEGVLQCVAVCCSVLQCAVVCCKQVLHAGVLESVT